MIVVVLEIIFIAHYYTNLLTIATTVSYRLDTALVSILAGLYSSTDSNILIDKTTSKMIGG